MSLETNNIVAQLLRERVRLTSLVVAVLRDVHAADDVFQQVVLSALQATEPFRDPEHLIAWALRAARHRAIDLLCRRDGESLDCLSPEALESLERFWTEWSRTEMDSRSEALQRCLAELPDSARELLRLRYEEGLSCGEIAGREGRTLDVIYQTLSRLHRRLRRCVEVRLGGDRTRNRGRMTRERLDDLIIRYMERAATPEETAELSAALVDSPAARARFAEFSLQRVGMVEQVRYKPSPDPNSVPGRFRSPRVRIAVLLAAGLLVVLGSVFLVGRVASPSLQLEQATGEVRIGSDRVLASPGMPVPFGATVTTIGPTSGVRLRAADGTRLVLAGDTSVQFENPGPFRVVVATGNLAAEVVDGPGVTIATAEVEVEAGAGCYAVGRSAGGTAVGVLHGTARVSNVSGAVLMDMADGEHATVGADGTRRRDRLQPLTNSYRWDSTQPLPVDWGVGKRTARDVPGEPGWVLRPEFWLDPHLGGRHCAQIRTNNAWTYGLAWLHPDSRLRVQFRLDRPGPGQILILVRPDPPDGGASGVFELSGPFVHRAVGIWHTIDVPVSSLRQNKSVPTGSPWVAYQVIVNSFEADLGLRIAEREIVPPAH